MKSQLLGQFEQLLMTAIVQRDRSARGLTIHPSAESLSGGSKVSLGAQFPTLDRLEDKGLIAPWLAAPASERAGRARRGHPLQADRGRVLCPSALRAQTMGAARAEGWGGAGRWGSR